jgi:hypothetical protein
MSCYSFNAAGEIQVDNGAAYSYVAGGAASYISPTYRWYTGANMTRYVGMLVSNRVEAWRIASLLTVRAAIVNAAVNHVNELGPLTNGGRVQLNPAEVMDDATLTSLIVRENLALAEWGDQVDGGEVVITKVPLSVRNQLVDATVVILAREAGRMAYSILALGGYGLITSAHHYRGQAVNAALNTAKMYGLDKVIRDNGLVPKEVIGFLFHDTLHPLAYEHLVAWANAIPPLATAKIAPTIAKRLPAFPGGTVFLQRAVTCSRVLSGAQGLGPLVVKLAASDVGKGLQRLHADVSANPLNYNEQFRPAEALARQPGITAVTPYAVILFGMYDAWVNLPRSEDGPTKGPGIKKMIEENMASYRNAVSCGQAIIGGLAAVTADDLDALVRALIMPAPLPDPGAAPDDDDDEDEDA